MTEDIDSIVQSININQVLAAILDEHGPITVPTLKFLDAPINKGLIIEYNEEDPSFTFSLRDSNE